MWCIQIVCCFIHACARVSVRACCDCVESFYYILCVSVNIISTSTVLATTGATVPMPDPAVEATAGALGTLLSCVLLYPVETAKVHIQAGPSKVWHSRGDHAIVRQEQTVLALFKGLPAKAVHVIANNYPYTSTYTSGSRRAAPSSACARPRWRTHAAAIAGVANLTSHTAFGHTGGESADVQRRVEDLCIPPVGLCRARPTRLIPRVWRPLQYSRSTQRSPCSLRCNQGTHLEFLGTDRLSALQARSLSAVLQRR